MQLARRLEKTRRYLRWRLALRGLPLWWHLGRPNFGDDINPTFFQKVAGLPARLATTRSTPHVLGAGSILGKATPDSIVCGAGFLAAPASPLMRPRELVAVRGVLSLAAVRGGESTLLGDPLVLIDSLVRPVPKRQRFGFVPHVTSVDRWRSGSCGRRLVIDPAADPWKVVEAIGSCEVVLSQSLHGLIVADALGVPNVWVGPSDEMVGGRFKFDDYFSTLEEPKECVRESNDLFARPESFAAAVGRYRFCKRALRTGLQGACCRLAESLGARTFFRAFSIPSARAPASPPPPAETPPLGH